MDNDIFQFSEREKEVIELLLQGKSNKQIALALEISASTVEYHLKNIYKKLQVSSRTEAVLRLGKSIGSNVTSELGKSVVEMNGENVNNDVQPISTRRIPLNKKYLSLVSIIVLVIIFVFVNMNGQTIEIEPTNDVPLPDLVITSVYVSIVDQNGNCLPYFGVIVTVVNQGNAPAVDVLLAEMNTAQEVNIGTLDVFQSITMPFVAKSTDGLYNVVVDPHNMIVESDENNNSVPYIGVTATPPISCLPRQFDDGTPTPSAPNTLAPTSESVTNIGFKKVNVVDKYVIEIPEDFTVHEYLSSSTTTVPSYRIEASTGASFSISVHPYIVSSSPIEGKCIVSTDFDAGIISAPIFCEGLALTNSVTIPENRIIKYEGVINDLSLILCTANSPCPVEVPAETRYSITYVFVIADKSLDTILEFYVSDAFRSSTDEIVYFEGLGAVLYNSIIPSLSTRNP